MTKKTRKKRTAACRRHPPRSKEMLLPMPGAAARACQLENHLALAALRARQGNLYQVGRLLKVVYLAHFLRAQFNITHAQLESAENVLKLSILRATDSGEYILENDECGTVAVVLAVHDEQLVRLPRYVIEEASARMIEYSSAQAAAMFMLADGLAEEIDGPSGILDAPSYDDNLIHASEIARATHAARSSLR